MITFRELGNLGRFGNQLFQYAGTRLYAQHIKSDFATPHWIGCDIFNNVHKWSVIQHINALRLPTVRLKDIRPGRKDYIKSKLGILSFASMSELYANPRNNINLYGYMQDEKSIDMIQTNIQTIREWFTPKQDIEMIIEHSIPADKYIAIHIRRGDFVKRNLSIPSSLYKDWLKKNNPDMPIYISSDDINIKKEFDDWKILDIKNPHSEIPNYIFDFWMLKNSKILLGCGSTFSWWASMLGGQQYVSPPLTHTWPKGYSPSLADITHDQKN